VRRTTPQKTYPVPRPSRTTQRLLPGILLLLLTIIALQGCSFGVGCGAEASNLLTDEELHDIGVSMEFDEPCLPPCWQGLTPAESTDQEILELLESAPFVRNIKTYQSDDGDLEVVTWDSALSFRSSTGYGGRIKLSDGVLVYITVELEYRLQLKEVIDQLGEPTLYSIMPCDAESLCLFVTLIWPQHGFALDLFEQSENAAVNPDMFVQRAMYFAVGTDATEFLIASGSSVDYAHLFQPWQGFENPDPR
jgi:hypothetical protein